MAKLRHALALGTGMVLAGWAIEAHRSGEHGEKQTRHRMSETLGNRRSTSPHRTNDRRHDRDDYVFDKDDPVYKTGKHIERVLEKIFRVRNGDRRK